MLATVFVVAEVAAATVLAVVDDNRGVTAVDPK